MTEVTERPEDVAPWTLTFCRREREMAALTDAWRRVCAPNPEPQVVALLAESGLGKTRLVQEFFGWLSTRHDGVGGAGYWPDALERRGNHLTVNPDPNACVSSVTMPFLWWGVRAQDPATRHTIPGEALRAGVAVLRPHLENVVRATRLQELDARSKKLLGKVSADAAAEILDTVTFGLLGALKTASEGMAELMSIRRERKELEATVDLGAIVVRERTSLIENIAADLGYLLTHPLAKAAPIPGVVFVDDAQFADSDPALSQLVLQLVRSARIDRWPLLIVITHWEREWYEGMERREGAFAWRLSSLLGEDWSPHPIGRVNDLGPLVDAALPGITEAQRDLLLKKADGNPRLLDEMLRHLRARPRYFTGRNLNAAMTTQAVAEIEELQFDLHALVEERLGHAPPEIQLALGLSALQGVRFLEALTLGAVARIATSPRSEAPLTRAERPHAFISRLGNGVAEFNQRTYRDVAYARIADLIDERDARRHLNAAFNALAGPDLEFTTLTAEQRPVAWALGTTLLMDDVTTAVDRRLACRCFAQTAKERREAADELTAAAVAERFLDAVERGALPLDLLEPGDAATLLESLCGGRNLSAARRFAKQLASLLNADSKASLESARAWRAIAAAHATFEGVRASARLSEISLTHARAAHAHLPSAASAQTLVLALINMAEVSWRLSQDAAMPEVLLEEAIRAAESAHAKEQTFQSQRAIFWAHAARSTLLRDAQRHELAMESSRKTLALAYNIQANDSSPRAKRLLVSALYYAGLSVKALEGDKAAEAPLKQAVELAREVMKIARSADTERDLAICTFQLACVSRDANMTLMDEALSMARERHERYQTTETRTDLWCMLTHFAIRRGGDGERALLDEALDLARKILEADETPMAFENLCQTYSSLAACEYRHGGPDLALPHYRNALEVARSFNARWDTLSAACALIDVLHALGQACTHTNRLEESRAAHRDALALARQSLARWPCAPTRHRLLISRLRTEQPQVALAVSDDESPNDGCQPVCGFTAGAGVPARTEEVAELLADLAETLGPVPSYVQPRVTAYRLSFYPGWQLYRLDGLCVRDGLQQFAFCLRGPTLSIPLDGSSTFLHALSAAAPLHLDRNTVLDFIRFFCEMLFARDGVFLIVTCATAIPFEHPAPEERIAELDRLLKPLTVTSEPTPTDARWHASATVLHGNGLFATTFTIDARGMIDMPTGELLDTVSTRVVRGASHGEWNLLNGWPRANSHGQNAELHVTLSHFLGYGRIVFTSPEEAVHELKALIAQGDVKATLALAHLYEAGRFVAADWPQALQLFRVAADHGDTSAMSALAFMYSTGRSGRADNVEAEKWFARATEHGANPFAPFDTVDLALWMVRQLHDPVGFAWSTPFSELISASSAARDFAAGIRPAEPVLGMLAPEFHARLAHTVRACGQDKPFERFANFMQELARSLKATPRESATLAEALLAIELRRAGKLDFDRFASEFEESDAHTFSRARERLATVGILIDGNKQP